MTLFGDPKFQDVGKVRAGVKGELLYMILFTLSMIFDILYQPSFSLTEEAARREFASQHSPSATFL